MKHPASLSANQSLFPYLVLVLILGVAAWIYIPVHSHGFIALDDELYLGRFQQVQDGLTPTGLVWAWTNLGAINWHPLTWMSHMLDVTLFGYQESGHHLVSLGWHLLNVTMVFWVARLYGGRVLAPLWAACVALWLAALFALHPVNVESVAWVSQRKNQLSGFFFLLTLLGYFHYTKTAQFRYYAYTLLAFFLGLASKPSLVSVPFVLLFLDHWPLGRAKTFAGKGTGRLWLEKLPFLALALAVSLLTFYAQKGTAVSSAENLSLTVRLANSAQATFIYLKTLLWPGDLAVLYPYPQPSPGWFAMAAAQAVILGLLTLFLFTRRRDYGALFTGWFWFLFLLAPVIGIVQVGRQALADRYLYLPEIGIFIMLGALVVFVAQRPEIHRFRWRLGVLVGVLVLYLGTLGLKTRSQVVLWQDTETLFTAGLERTTGNYFLAAGLAKLYLDRGDYPRALHFADEAVLANSHFAEGYALAGRAWEALGDEEHAGRAFRRAVEVSEGNTGYVGDLALHHTRHRRFAESLALIEDHASSQGMTPRFWRLKGYNLRELGEIHAAAQAYRNALAEEPGNYLAVQAYADLLWAEGSWLEAISVISAGVEANPDDLRLATLLARAFRLAGRPELAVEIEKMVAERTRLESARQTFTLRSP